MAVRVVKRELDPSVVKRVICEHCGVTLEYTPNDVLEWHGTDIGGGPYGQTWVNCPNCKKKAIISSW